MKKGQIGLLLGVAAAAAALTPGPEAQSAASFTANVTNPWYPLKPGTTYTYTGVKDGQPSRDVLKVTRRTKMIAGVPCRRDHATVENRAGQATEKRGLTRGDFSIRILHEGQQVAGFFRGDDRVNLTPRRGMPRVKIGGAQKSDGEQGLILTCPYQALYNPTSTNTNGLEATTLQIHDSNDTMA